MEKTRGRFFGKTAAITLMLATAAGFAQKGPQTAKNTGSIEKTDIIELRRRINAARWPDKETVTDEPQGVKLEKIQQLAKYWGAAFKSLR